MVSVRRKMNGAGLVSSWRTVGCAMLCAMALAGCSSGGLKKSNSKYSPRVVKLGEPVPQGGGAYKVGSAYKIKGRTYKPAEQPGYDKVGTASWYGTDFHGRKTANGEVYDMNSFTAAHTTLPLPSYVRVTNLGNSKSVVVRVNDRGPFAHDRIIDLSRKTAETLGFKRAGTAKVRVQYVGRAPLDGQDQWLTTTVRDHGANRETVRIDKRLASRAFAQDGQYNGNEERYQVAANAYRGRGHIPAAPSAPAPAAPPPVMVAQAPIQQPARQVVAVNTSSASNLAPNPVVQAGVFRNADSARALALKLEPSADVTITRYVDAAGDLFSVTMSPRPGGPGVDALLTYAQSEGTAVAQPVVY